MEVRIFICVFLRGYKLIYKVNGEDKGRLYKYFIRLGYKNERNNNINIL